ncbi:MAG: serine/threonine-protein phosphatase [Proteobacteria bacterium]|nr:serine/threonine-protein phosphatase [Pseudomonadota bacterium]
MSAEQLTPPIQAWGHSHKAQRAHNEDALLIDLAQGLVVVADGVGGQDAGEVASGLTCEVLAREVAAGSTLVEAIRKSNEEVFEAVNNGLGRQGMATTVVALHFDGADYELAWLGDSRAYLWDDSLSLLSRDHSYVETLIASNHISIEEARLHPKKNIVTQAVGAQNTEQLNIGTNSGRLQPGQVILLCSDGLNDAVPTAGIVDILSADESLEVRCQQLVGAALNAGGRDNITAVLIEGSPSLVVREGTAIPDFVWSYDAATAQYKEFREPSSKPVVAVKRIAARTSDETQLMASPPVGAQGERDKQPRRIRVYLLCGLLFAAAMLYLSLFNNGY